MKNRTEGQASTPLGAEELVWRQLSLGLQALAQKPAVDFVAQPIALEPAEVSERLASGTWH